MFGVLNFFKKDTTSSKEAIDMTLLPRGILEAIVLDEKHEIGKKELLRLVRDGEGKEGRFSNAALFMALKAHVKSPRIQESIITDVVRGLSKIASQDNVTANAIVRDIAERYISEIPEDARVDGAKLKRINLAGFKTWDGWFAEVGRRYAKDRRDVFFVAHSTLIGLSSYIRIFREEGKVLYILLPQNLPSNGDDPDLHAKANRPAGYSIAPNGEVHTLGKYFDRPQKAVVVDDIKNTGATQERLAKYWTLNGSSAPDFEPLEKINGA